MSSISFLFLSSSQTINSIHLPAFIYYEFSFHKTVSKVKKKFILAIIIFNNLFI